LPAALVPKWYQRGELASQHISKRGDILVPRQKTGKNADLHLRVDTQLKLYVSNKAREAHKSINDYCIDILRNYEYADRLLTIESTQKQKIKLLTNIANNINQLARHCNTLKEAPQKDILMQIFDVIRKIR
jgi:hypothetical protein